MKGNMKQESPISHSTVLLVGILTFSTAIILSMCSTGCIIKRPEGSTNYWINTASRIATNVTYASVSDDLLTHPEHRQTYVMAERALKQLLDKDSITATDLANIIAGLPIKKFQSGEGVLWVITLATIFDTSSGMQLDISSTPAVRQVGGAIRDGLHAALYPKAEKARTLSERRPIIVKGRISI